MAIERRFFTFELRAESQGEEMSLVGYASKFNNESSDLGGFREMVMPGAFARSIREASDVHALMNHDPSLVLGRTKNGTLKLEEDATGLRFKVKLPPTQTARDLHALVSRGDIDSCSFAFQPKSQSWEDAKSENGDMYALRRLHDVDLHDVSVVTNPAYPNTEVNARALFGSDEVPVEIRSAVKEIEEKRGGPGSGRRPEGKKEDDKEGKGDPKAFHNKMAKEHLEAANEHEYESTFAHQDGNHKVGDAHSDAADAHYAAASAHSAAAAGKGSASKSAAAKEATIAAYTKSDSAFDTPMPRSVSEWPSREKRAAGQSLCIEPYSISLPQPFGDKEKGKWVDAYMDALKDATKRLKLKYQDAVAYAVAEANKATGVDIQTEVTPEVSGQKKNPSTLPHQVVKTDGVGRSAYKAELRYSEGTFEDQIADVNCALKDKYGNTSSGCYMGCQKYWIVETYPDHVVVQDNDQQDCYYDIPYTYDGSAEEGQEVSLGEMSEVKKQFVPSGRSLELAPLRVGLTIQDIEERKKKAADADAAKQAAAATAKRDRTKQVSDPDSPDYDPDDSDYDPNWDDSADEDTDEENSRGDKTAPEDDTDDDDPGDSADKPKTRKIGKVFLTADKFAWVGDEKNPSTWKLPLDTQKHAERALVRFAETKDILAEQKEETWKKIVKAARGFSIEVTEERSLKAGMSHEVTQSVINELITDEGILAALRARARMIEIEL